MSCGNPALLPDTPPVIGFELGVPRREPSDLAGGRCGDQERVRGGGVRTALAGLEAAAVPTGACDPEAARQADSASLPVPLLSLRSLLPSPAPCSSDPARGAEGLEPSLHHTLWSGQVVRERQGGLLGISNGGAPGAVSGKRLPRRAAPFGGAGGGPGRFSEPLCRLSGDLGRREGPTPQDCVAQCPSFFRSCHRRAKA